MCAVSAAGKSPADVVLLALRSARLRMVCRRLYSTSMAVCLSETRKGPVASFIEEMITIVNSGSSWVVARIILIKCEWVAVSASDWMMSRRHRNMIASTRFQVCKQATV